MILFPLMNKVWIRITFWRELSRQRKQLMMMDDHLLKDIGLSRTEAEHEAKRHFWDYAQVQANSPWRCTKPAADISIEDRECSLHA